MHRAPWAVPLIVAFSLFSLGPASGLQAAAAAADQAASYQGWIVDRQCGKENAKQEGIDCTKRCHDQGIALVFYDEKAEKIYELDDQKKAAAHIGYVKIVGTLDGGKLKISTIDPV